MKKKLLNFISDLKWCWFMATQGTWELNFWDEYYPPFFSTDQDTLYEWGYITGWEYSIRVWRIYVAISFGME